MPRRTILYGRPSQHGYISSGANYAVRRYARNSLVGFVILLAGLGYAWHTGAEDAADSRDAIAKSSRASATAIVASGRALAVDSCNRDFKNTGRLRGLLLRAEAEIPKAVKKGRFSKEEAADALEFYDKELARIPLPDCRLAEVILTDDPSKPVQQPVPLHP